MPSLDDMMRGTRSFEQLSADADAMRDAMQRLRNARWAMPAGELVFPKVPFNEHDFNALVENPCFQSFMTDIRRVIYDQKIGLGFGASVLDNALVEGLAMVFGIFDDIEREMFPEDLSQPETPSLQED